MNTHRTPSSQRSRAGRATRTLVAAALAVGVLTLSACDTSAILEVEDPDIINPSDVRSAAGANAVRLGALARFTDATSGGESLFLLGGLFADEFQNGDTFIARQEVDQRVLTPQNGFLDGANRALHRARLSAEQAVTLLGEFAPGAPNWQVAEMHFIQGYLINIMAEHYCDGMAFSTVVDGAEQFGEQLTTEESYELALARTNEGLALITGTTASDLRVLNALRLTRGRILNNLGRRTEAAAAVAEVPTSYRYNILHSATASTNAIWFWNINQFRYSVSDAEGQNGLNFATAEDPRLPVCAGGDAECRTFGITQATKNDATAPVYYQLLWPDRESPVTILTGVEARLIEAEAQLATNPAAAYATLNAARATVPGLAPLVDPGNAAARVDQLFRERAFSLFARGYRTGDLRRLIRQYGRAPDSVFPTGPWFKGGNYGTDVTLLVPLSEENNPNVATGQSCLNRDA